MSWLVLALVALALRLPDIGNPLIDIDEQMYLLVGDRMWHGALPYVDIWDRKPVGLFLIYAGAAGLGGDGGGGVVAYQWLALVAAVATAGLIAMLARRIATPVAGIAAGIVYLGWIELLGGRGGQSPVFYDLPMAAAALLGWRCTVEPGPRPRRAGLAAMLLVGLALQIKPTAVFEGGFIGLALLIAEWRRHGGRSTIGYGAALVAAALLPTVVAGGVYAAIGHGGAWWFANVESIFLRRVTPHAPIAGRLVGLGLNLLVPFAAALLGLSRQRGASLAYLGGWLAAALVGVLAIPPYFNHYALPLVVPIAVLAGTAMAASRWLGLMVVAAAAALLAWSGYPHRGEAADARRRLATLTATIERYRQGRGCLFVFQAAPVLYRATGSCLPTRYPFAPHLTFASEAGAIGVDPATEVARVLASRPPVIVSAPPAGDVNLATFGLVRRALARDYRIVGHGMGYTVYARPDETNARTMRPAEDR